MNLGPRQIGVLAILTCILLVPTSARAAMLGLDAGTYDVTLTCAFVGCGGPFTGTLTTDGNDVTSWLFDTSFDGVPLSFSSDPAEFDSGPVANIQKVVGDDTTGGFTLVLFGGTFAGDWSIDSSGVSFWNGTWTAEPHEDTGTVPEPASMTLVALGLSAAGLARCRRKPSR